MESCCPQSFLLVCQDVFVVGLADGMLRDRILQLCSVILLSGERRREERRPLPAGSGTLTILTRAPPQTRGTCASLQPCGS